MSERHPTWGHACHFRLWGLRIQANYFVELSRPGSHPISELGRQLYIKTYRPKYILCAAAHKIYLGGLLARQAAPRAQQQDTTPGVSDEEACLRGIEFGARGLLKQGLRGPRFS